MAAAVYYSWLSAGKPVNPSRPIREYVERLKAAFPRAASVFSWYADEGHYTAVPPQDHTPFSATGWPVASPHWFVFATDVMHRPDLGVDCGVLFPYWLSEAKAGRTPWVKYLIWQAQLYDSRNGWKPQANSGHFDHIHISVRTDWKDKGLGSWSLTPGGDDMYEQYDRDRVTDTWGRVTAMQATLVAMQTVINHLAAVIDAGSGSVDVAAIKAEIRDAVADLGEGGATQVRADAD